MKMTKQEVENLLHQYRDLGLLPYPFEQIQLYEINSSTTKLVQDVSRNGQVFAENPYKPISIPFYPSPEAKQ